MMSIDWMAEFPHSKVNVKEWREYADGQLKLWEVGKSCSSPIPISKNSVKKIIVYSFITSKLKNDPKLIKGQKFLSKEDYPISKIKRSSENPFNIGFLALFRELPNKVKKQDRNDFSKQLYYAYFKKVPVEYLVGFLHQEGGIKLIRKRFKELELYKDIISDD